MSRLEIDVRVRFSGGTHVARHGKRTASCAWSAAEAVRRLAAKLEFRPGFDVVRRGAELLGDGEVWRIVDLAGPGR